MGRLHPILLFLLISISLHAQNPEWINFTGKNNLVMALGLEDSCLWIGTYGELVKLNINTNEKEFFNASNSGLTVNFVRTIFVDHNKNKWFGTYDGGLIKYDNSTWQVFHENNSGLPDNSIHAITEDNYGNIWVTTMFGGIAKYDGKTFQIFTEKEISYWTDEPECITFDHNNKLWAGITHQYPGGLLNYDGTTWNVFNTRNSNIPTDQVFSIAVDSSNKIWLGTDSGLVKYDGTEWTSYKKSDSKGKSVSIKNIFIDDKENIWTVSSNEVAMFNQTNWVTYDSSYFSDLYGYNYQVIVDKKKVYVTNWENGLLKYDGVEWSKDDLTNSLFPSNFVTSIGIDRNNSVWVEAAGNLLKFQGTNFTQFKDSAIGIKEYGIYELDFDSKNNMWLNLYKENKLALGKYDGYNSTIIEDNSQPQSRFFDAMTIDKNDEIWLVASLGIRKYNGQWTVYNKDNSGLQDNYVRGIAVDSKNNKWIATMSGGLVKYDGTAWTVFNKSNSQIGCDTIYNVAVDNNDNIWVGTSRALMQFYSPNNNPQWKNKGVYNENLFHYFRNMKFDSDNNLYIAEYGITKFNGSTYTQYDIFNSGLPENNIQTFSIDKYNNKWIGGQGGLSIFNEKGIVSEIKINDEFRHLDIYKLMQNYPNPFNPTTNIQYSVVTTQFVSLKVYDVLGNEVATLVNEEKQPGSYQVSFNTQQTTNNRQLSSGVYFYQLRAGNFVQTKKMIVLK